ncbi:C4b-binding protein alpha chain-like isoform X3 [Cyprinus carpio]|uniref:C4b-binding protein alpha chain-like isoform X3 n=1 Tax=Cyprinus carpio TaxID=7962 RepID=A0A9Q9ZFB6_CYPCA|nr:C4b-binding protein alpha chain-like isoform X3 [Cyprinus carpio]
MKLILEAHSVSLIKLEGNAAENNESITAECPFPVLSGTVVLSSASILKNSFSDNSEAFVECAKGYTRDKGPTSISCVNGVWSPVELICKKIDCGQPKLLPHMTYSIPDGTLFGAYIQPKCETGYDLEGSSYRQCLVTGWSGKAECILTECEYPDPIENGKMVAPRQPVFNDVITYSCDDNYTLVGNSSITCGEYGEYSSPRPKCIAIECSVPEVRFGNRTEGNPPFFYKSEATFECWPGYSMKGLATSVCEKSGWSALPVCDEVIITPTKASTTTNIATTTDMTTASTRSHGGLGAKLFIITPTKSSTTTNKATTDMTTASTRSHGGLGANLSAGASTVGIIAASAGASTVGIITACASAGVIIAAFVFFVRHLKRTGSYNTGEELRAKEELLLNQSI